MRKTYFTPGPAELFPTVEQHYRDAFDLQLGSISHRSAQFRKIYQHTVEQLRTLMNIPESNVIIRDILCSVATLSKQEQHNIDSKGLHQLSMNDLRARLALLGDDFDGSKEALIIRLKGVNSSR